MIHSCPIIWWGVVMSLIIWWWFGWLNMLIFFPLVIWTGNSINLGQKMIVLKHYNNFCFATKTTWESHMEILFINLTIGLLELSMWWNAEAWEKDGRTLRSFDFFSINKSMLIFNRIIFWPELDHCLLNPLLVVRIFEFL